MTPKEYAKAHGIIIPDAIRVLDGSRRLDQVKTEWNVGEILKYSFPDPNWIVPGLIPEGLSILGGRPKTGKSWLMLQAMSVISRGGTFFNQECEPKKCLYLALEDNPRRIKNRLLTQNLNPSEENLTIRTSLPKPLDKGGMKWLREEIEKNQYQFIAIDTISRAIQRKLRQTSNDDMGEVYDGLQEMSLDLSVALTLIDHLNKMYKDVDFLDAITGATSKTGVADAILGLRKERRKQEATLETTGRDISENEFVLEFDRERCIWKMLGDKDEIISDKTLARLVGVIQNLEDGAVQSKLPEVLKWSKSYVSKIVNQGIKEGLIIRTGRGEPLVAYTPYEKKVKDDMIRIMSNNGRLT